MSGEIFYWFLNMSVSGTITAFAVLLLSRIKRLPRRVCYALWAIPFIRLWFPFAPVGRFGLMELIMRLSSRSVIVPGGSQYTASMATLNHMALADSYYPFQYRSALLMKVFNTASIVWLCIAFLIAVFIVFSYYSLKHEIKRGCFSDGICFTDAVKVPAVYGIISPIIVMPENRRACDNTFILIHEAVHIRRMDNLWRAVALATVAVHWFNPFIWLFLKSFLNEMELSCDEKVLSQLNGDERQAYALALIESAEAKLTLASSFSGGKLRQRIERILVWKRMSAFATVCFVGFGVVIAYVLIANPI